METIGTLCSLQEIRDKKHENLSNLLLQERSSLGQLYLLNEMTRTRSSIDLNSGETAEERIEAIYLESGVRKRWMSVRYAAALLRKVVDCLAPSLTGMLVRGKEVNSVFCWNFDGEHCVLWFVLTMFFLSLKLCLVAKFVNPIYIAVRKSIPL